MGLLDDLKKAAAGEGPDEYGDSKYAPAWRWEKAGDGVEGVVIHVDRRVHDNHPDGYPIVTVRHEDGTDVSVHGMTTVLRKEIEDRQLRVGDLFAAIYDGKKTSGNNRQFHAFRVAHQQGVPGAPLPAAVPVAAAAPMAPFAGAPKVADPWDQLPAQSGADIPPF